MRLILLLGLISVWSLNVMAVDGYQLKGEVKGLDAGTAKIFTFDIIKMQTVDLGTAAIENGKFEIT